MPKEVRDALREWADSQSLLDRIDRDPGREEHLSYLNYMRVRYFTPGA